MPIGSDIPRATAQGAVGDRDLSEAELVAFGHRLGGTFAAALAGEGDWADRFAMALADALELLAGEPELATQLAAPVPSGPIAELRADAVERLGMVLTEGREAAGHVHLPPISEQILARGAIDLVACRAFAGRAEGLTDLTDELAIALIAPYLGSLRARRSAFSAARWQRRRTQILSPAAGHSALPAGRHRISADRIAGDQRRRMLSATARLLAERGPTLLTVDAVVELARVSKRTFYENFTDIDACLLACYRDAEERLWATGTAAARGEPTWPARVVASVGATLEFLAGEPTSPFLLREARAANPAIASRYRETIERLANLLRHGRVGVTDAAELPQSTESVLIETAVAAIYSESSRGNLEHLPALAPQLAELLLSPYLGAEAAVAAARGER